MTLTDKAPILIAETYHSRIEKVDYQNIVALKKTARKRTERTIEQWETEAKVMRLIAAQSDPIIQTMSLLLTSDFDDLSLTMRLEAGQSVDQHVSATSMCTLSARDADLIWLNIGSAIGFLHSHLVLHDDVKPDNIIWIPDQHRAVLIDFGAAIVAKPGEELRFSPSGTPPYAPPEFLKRQKRFEGDVWSLGVSILFAKQYISLPTGGWILPKCFEEEEPLKKMQAWLSEIETLRLQMLETDVLLAGMLEADPDQRLTGVQMMQVLEARLEQASILKKVVDAIKDLVQDCNFDCNDSGIALQAMDNSHVALVSMMLKSDTFSPFRCDRNIALGINLNSFQKVLRCAQNEDILTLKADDSPDSVGLVFESAEQDRISEYDIKLMDIDQEHLGIPDTEYAATITMPSGEFQRICRDLSALSESVSIEAEKNAVKFTCNGDIGNGAISLRNHTSVEKPEQNVGIELSEPVSLTFSLKYLVNFCKASGLSGSVKLCLSNEVPLLVEYELASNSYLRFYLAPKIGDDE